MTRDHKGIELRDRDFEILRGLLESRVMTLTHLAGLHFNGSKDAAKTRIRSLKNALLIGERPRRVNQPSVHFLTKRGFRELSKTGRLTDLPEMTWEQLEKRVRVSDLTLRHELQVMDVKAALCAAIQKEPGLELETFHTWPSLYEFEALVPPEAIFQKPTMVIRPDGFLHIFDRQTQLNNRFFLEVDRSTESQGILALHAQCYQNHYRFGGFAEWCGGRKDEYEKYPFCVLMICQNAERRNNTAEKLLLLSKPILRLVWLTTIDEVCTNPLGPIWMTPHAYRTATTGTEFDVKHIRDRRGYRRSVQREEMVEKNVVKRALITGRGDVLPCL